MSTEDLSGQGGAGSQGGQNNNSPAGGTGGNPAGGEGKKYSFASMDEAQSIIESLRNENASRRTKGKSLEDQLSTLTEKFGKISAHLGLEEQEVDPVEHIQGLTQQTAALEMQLAITQMARAHSIPVEHDEYFNFLVSKRIQEFEENSEDGAELPEDFFEQIANEVSVYGGGQKRSSIGVGGQTPKAPAKPNTEMTAEQFASLSLSQKVELKGKNPELYSQLFSEAVNKRLIK